MNELVSIVMPAYNAEKYIYMAIMSAIEQTYKNWELIIVNDCSTDGTLDIIRSFNDSRIKAITNDENKGVSISRKIAVEASKGDWIAFLDSDDAWEQRKLEKQMIVKNEKNAQLIFTASSFMNDDGNDIDWVLNVPEKICYKKLLKQNVISNSSVLVSKELYAKHMVLDDNLHEDFACWLGILKSGVVAYGIDEPLLKYRLANSSKSSNKIKAAKMNWKTYKCIGLNYFEASYYMCWYTINGVLKYRNLK